MKIILIRAHIQGGTQGARGVSFFMHHTLKISQQNYEVGKNYVPAQLKKIYTKLWDW